jgi:hypothetical protein
MTAVYQTHRWGVSLMQESSEKARRGNRKRKSMDTSCHQQVYRLDKGKDIPVTGHGDP